MKFDGIGKIPPFILIAAVLAAAVLLVYGQTGQFDFIHSYDDREYVVDNTHIHQGLSVSSVAWAFTTFYAANWHPVTWLSHMLDIELFGMNPGGHHLTNAVWHLVNTLLLFLLLRRMTLSTWRSAAVAALFAMHPLHVESVAMIAERKDVLSTCFWMMTLHCYVSYASSRSRIWYALALGCFCLGLLAKPMVVSLPFVLLLLDYWPLQRWRPASSATDVQLPAQTGLRPLVLEKIPFLAMSAVSSVVTLLAQHSLGATGSMTVYPLFHRLANASVSTIAYLAKTIWPHPLVVFYPYRETIAIWQWMGAGALLAAVTVAVLMVGSKMRYLICGWLWYLITLLPVIGVVQVGAQAMADRYTYIPLIGIFIMVVWGLHEALQQVRLKPAAVFTAAALLLAALGTLSWKQARHWTDSVSLFQHAARYSEDNWVAHNNLGSALVRRGYPAAALVHYQTALEIAPGYADARYNLAATQSELGRHDEAIRQYRQVLAATPAHTGALNNLCGELVSAGKVKEGMTYCRKAIAIDPNFANPYNNLAVALTKMGRLPEAIQRYQQAIALDKQNPESHQALGKLLAADGRIVEAAQFFHTAWNLDPDNERHRRQAADALMRGGAVAAAAEFYAAALRLNPGSADTYNRLGVAYARLGLRDDAVIMFQTALEMNPEHRAASGNLQKALTGR